MAEKLIALTLLSCAPLLIESAQSSTSNPLHGVKRVFVAQDFGRKAEDAALRRELISDLRKSQVFEVVNSAGDADAVLTGTADVYVKGYFSLNPRAGVLPKSGEPVYGGSVSVELKDKGGETLWSYLAASRSEMRNPSQELAKDVVKHLVTVQKAESR